MGRSHILLNLLYFRIRHLASGFSINTVNTDFGKVEQVEQMFVTGRLIVKMLREIKHDYLNSVYCSRAKKQHLFVHYRINSV